MEKLAVDLKTIQCVQRIQLDVILKKTFFYIILQINTFWKKVYLPAMPGCIAFFAVN